MNEDPAGDGESGDRRTREAGDDRDRIAEDRDKRAEAHDHKSEDRDKRAEARDERAETREVGAVLVDEAAGADRDGARRDRDGGASDRTYSSRDREAASLDRMDAAADRKHASAMNAYLSTDDLTGAYHRGPGNTELEREIARSRRTNTSLTVAFVDVDALKHRNDSEGHAAGDRLLRETAATIRSHFRPYDLLIRYGGDEFVCGLFDMEMTEAAERFALVNRDLEAAEQASVTIGLATLTDSDALAELLARADADMYKGRQRSLGHLPRGEAAS
jgi:diguanylate cyclase (GGDEF)-like protein